MRQDSTSSQVQNWKRRSKSKKKELEQPIIMTSSILSLAQSKIISSSSTSKIIYSPLANFSKHDSESISVASIPITVTMPRTGTRTCWGNKKEAFLHVAQNVMCLSPSEITAFVDSDFNDILLLKCMSEADLSHIVSMTMERKNTTLSTMTIECIKVFVHFLHHLEATDQFPRNNMAWFSLSCDDFDAFCQSTHARAYHGISLDNIYTVERCSVNEYYKLQHPFGQEERQAFLHVLEVIDLTTGEIQRLEDCGVTTISKLQNITESQISFIFPSPRDEDAKELVVKFVYFYHHMNTNDHPILTRDLMHISADDFQQFCPSNHYLDNYHLKSLEDSIVAIDTTNTISSEHMHASPGANEKVSIITFLHDDISITTSPHDDIGASKIYTTPLAQTERIVPIFSEILPTSFDYDDFNSAYEVQEKRTANVSAVQELDNNQGDDLDVNAVDPAAVATPTRPAVLDPTRVLAKDESCNKKSVSLRPTLYPFIPMDLFGTRLGSDGDVNENDKRHHWQALLQYLWLYWINTQGHAMHYSYQASNPIRKNEPVDVSSFQICANSKIYSPRSRHMIQPLLFRRTGSYFSYSNDDNEPLMINPRQLWMYLFAHPPVHCLYPAPSIRGDALCGEISHLATTMTRRVQSTTTLNNNTTKEWENGETTESPPLEDNPRNLYNRASTDLSTKQQKHVDPDTSADKRDVLPPYCSDKDEAPNHHVNIQAINSANNVPVISTCPTQLMISELSNNKIMMLHHMWNYYSNCNGKSDSTDNKHKAHDKMWYADHAMTFEGQSSTPLEWVYWEATFKSLPFIIALLGLITFLTVILNRFHIPTIVAIEPSAGLFAPQDTLLVMCHDLSQVVHLVGKPRATHVVSHNYGPSMPSRVLAKTHLANLAMSHHANSVKANSTLLQEQSNSQQNNDYHKIQSVIPAVPVDYTTMHYPLLMGSHHDSNKTYSFVHKSQLVHPHPKIDSWHQALPLSPAYNDNTSRMIVMYHSLFTGRPPGLLLATSRLAKTQQTKNRNNKKVNDLVNNLCDQQEQERALEFDIDLYHDLPMGRSAIKGILYSLNRTWYDKKRQSNVENVTYGYGFIAAHTCIEQAIMELCNMQQYLRANIHQKSFNLEEHKATVDSTATTTPHARLRNKLNLNLLSNSNMMVCVQFAAHLHPIIPCLTACQLNQ